MHYTESHGQKVEPGAVIKSKVATMGTRMKNWRLSFRFPCLICFLGFRAEPLGKRLTKRVSRRGFGALRLSCWAVCEFRGNAHSEFKSLGPQAGVIFLIFIIGLSFLTKGQQGQRVRVRCRRSSQQKRRVGAILTGCTAILGFLFLLRGSRELPGA